MPYLAKQTPSTKQPSRIALPVLCAPLVSSQARPFRVHIPWLHKSKHFFAIHSPSKAGFFKKKKPSTFSQEYCTGTSKSSTRLDSGKPKKKRECMDLTYKSNASCTIKPNFQTDLHHLPEMLQLVNDTG